MPSPRLLCALWFLSGPAAWTTAAPQSAPASLPFALRDKLLGECREAGGKPWARAQVTLWSCPLPGRWDFGVMDQILAECDEEGRFKAALLPLRTYVALACAPGEGDAVWFSEVAAGIRAGERLVLTRAQAPERPTRLRLGGIEAWQAAGVTPAELRVSARRGAAPPCVLEPGRDGLVTIPARPSGSGPVAVTLPGGRPLASRSIRVFAPGESRPDVIPLDLNPPVRVRAVVRVKSSKDKKDGKDKKDADREDRPPQPPIAGARLWLGKEYSREDWHPVGTTDAAGACDFWIEGPAGEGEPGALAQEWHLQVDAPGHAILERPIPASAGDTWNAAERLRTVTCHAAPGYSARGRLLGADRKPLAGVRLLLSIQGSEQEDEHSYNGFSVDYRPVVTNADGSFVLPSLSRECGFQLLVDAAEAGLFPAAADLPSQALAVLAEAQSDGKPELDLGELGAHTVGVAALEVRAPDGAPVAYPRALLVTSKSPIWAAPELPEFRGDRRGRVALRVPAGEYSLLVWDRGLVRVEPVVVKAGPATGPAPSVTLEKALPVRGRIVDSAGNPVPGASVYVRQSRSSGGPGLEQRERQARELFNRQSLKGTADAAGRVECWFLPIPGSTWGLACHTRFGERWVTSGLVQVAGEPVEDAEFVLPATQPVPEEKGRDGDAPSR